MRTTGDDDFEDVTEQSHGSESYTFARVGTTHTLLHESGHESLALTDGQDGPIPDGTHSYTIGNGSAYTYTLVKDGTVTYTVSERGTYDFSNTDTRLATTGDFEITTSDFAQEGSQTYHLSQAGTDSLTLSKHGQDSYSLSEAGSRDVLAGTESFAVDATATASYQLDKSRQESFTLEQDSVRHYADAYGAIATSDGLSLESGTSNQSGVDSFTLQRQGSETYDLLQTGDNHATLTTEIVGVSAPVTTTSRDRFTLTLQGSDTYALSSAGSDHFSAEREFFAASGGLSESQETFTQEKSSSFDFVKRGSETFSLTDEGQGTASGPETFSLTKDGVASFVLSESGASGLTLFQVDSETTSGTAASTLVLDEFGNHDSSYTKTGTDTLSYQPAGGPLQSGTETFQVVLSNAQDFVVHEESATESGDNYEVLDRTFDRESSSTYTVDISRSDSSTSHQHNYDSAGLHIAGSGGAYTHSEPSSTDHLTTTDPLALLPDALPLMRLDLPVAIQGVPLGRPSPLLTEMGIMGIEGANPVADKTTDELKKKLGNLTTEELLARKVALEALRERYGSFWDNPPNEEAARNVAAYQAELREVSVVPNSICRS